MNGSREVGGRHGNSVHSLQFGGALDGNQALGGMSHYSGGAQFVLGLGNGERPYDEDATAFGGSWPNA